MKIALIIPARYASTRYPGKPLACLKGASGEAKTLLERTILAGRTVVPDAGDEISFHVATDDHRIADEAQRVGVRVIMTRESCRNGTERVAEAIRNAELSPEIVINLQGDAPLTPPSFVSALIRHMKARPSAQIATPILRCDEESVKNLIADRKAGRVGATTVVANHLGQALYFSKEVIPFTNDQGVADGMVPVFHHVGLYAYRPAALDAYRRWQMGPLERIEGLEQLRFLENGQTVDVVKVSANGRVFWELNNPSDIPLIEASLTRMGID